MGTGASRKIDAAEQNDSVNQAQRNNTIEQQIAQDKIKRKAVVKILLLGGAASGKSTIFKQMRILHLNGFTEADFLHYRPLVHANIIQAIQQLLDGCYALNISTESLKEETDTFQKFISTITNVTGIKLGESKDNVTAISKLWSSTHVQECYQRRNEIQLLDSAKYFLDDLKRIAEPQYFPTNEDILRARAATTGIHELEFQAKRHKLKMVDVGGQKSEQRKWIHCFDDVQAILFVVDTSGYDRCLEENEEEVLYAWHGVAGV